MTYVLPTPAPLVSPEGLPIIAVLTHCDEIEPSDLKRPDDYDDEKLQRIADAKQLFLRNVAKLSPMISQHIVGIEAISSTSGAWGGLGVCVSRHLLQGAVVWLPPNEQGQILPNTKRDYRYNIDGLLDLLLRNVQIQAVFRTVQGNLAHLDSVALTGG